MKYSILAMSILFFVVSAGISAADDFKFSMSIRDEGKKSFYLSVGSHYKVQDRTIAYAHRKGIPDDDLPVLFYLSKRTGAKPEALVSLRLGGKSWADITLSFGLGADIFYVPMKSPPGPPYGNAYGHFKNHPKNKWNKIILADADVVNLVNLKFMSGHYGMSPEAVIKFRAKNKSFISLNMTLKKNKQAKNKIKAMNKNKIKVMDKNKKSHQAKPVKSSTKNSKKAGGHSGKKGKK